VKGIIVNDLGGEYTENFDDVEKVSKLQCRVLIQPNILSCVDFWMEQDWILWM
jgi:hypothetical protein